MRRPSGELRHARAVPLEQHPVAGLLFVEVDLVRPGAAAVVTGAVGQVGVLLGAVALGLAVGDDEAAGAGHAHVGEALVDGVIAADGELLDHVSRPRGLAVYAGVGSPAEARGLPVGGGRRRLAASRAARSPRPPFVGLDLARPSRARFARAPRPPLDWGWSKPAASPRRSRSDSGPAAPPPWADAARPWAGGGHDDGDEPVALLGRPLSRAMVLDFPGPSY